MASRFFGTKAPAKPHLLRSGSGMPKEITDLRADVEEAFLQQQTEAAGTTAQRPLVPFIGQEYFDATLGYSIVWNGTAWVSGQGPAGPQGPQGIQGPAGATGPAGSGGGGFSSTSTLTTLAALANPGAPAIVQVASNLGYYIFDPNSALTADGITVIAPQTGSGRWLRQFWGHDFWRNQATWYIDSTNGNDEADGSSSGTPIKSLKEFTHRLARRSYATALAINILGTSFTDSLTQIILELPPTGTLTITGTQTVTATGTITTASSAVASTNTPAKVQDTNVADWSTFGGARLLFTSTRQTFIGSDLGNGEARVVPWTAVSGLGSSPPTAGTAYSIADLTTVSGVPTIFGSNATTTITLVNLRWSAALSLLGGGVCGSVYSFRTCYIPSLFLEAARVTITKCSIGILGSSNGGISQPSLTISTSLIGGGCSLVNGTIAQFTSCLFDTCGLFISASQATLSSIGIFDAESADGLDIRSSAQVVLSSGLFGTGNGSYGLRIIGSSRFTYSTIPTITGVNGDLAFTESTPIPPLVGGADVPAGANLSSWAELAAAPFNGCVFSYKNGAYIGNL